MALNCREVKFSWNLATFFAFRRHLIRKSRWMNTFNRHLPLCLKIWKQVKFLRRYEKSNDGTKNPWYESSMARNVHQWYETSKVRKVYGTKSPAFLCAHANKFWICHCPYYLWIKRFAFIDRGYEKVWVLNPHLAVLRVGFDHKTAQWPWLGALMCYIWCQCCNVALIAYGISSH